VLQCAAESIAVCCSVLQCGAVCGMISSGIFANEAPLFYNTANVSSTRCLLFVAVCCSVCWALHVSFVGLFYRSLFIFHIHISFIVLFYKSLYIYL
jgi:hypothetical protein